MNREDNTEIQVFLSGTRRDLRPFFDCARRAVVQLPGYRPVSMDSRSPEDIPPDKWSRREATTPDLLVGLVGHYYGTRTTGADLSPTEQEYIAAGRAGIDRLMFLTDSGDREVVRAQEAADQAAMGRFRERISQETFRATVKTPEEFAQAVVAAIREWERRTFRGATVDVEEYYRPWLLDDPLHGHQTQLTGHEDEVDRLDAFVQGEAKVLLLHAPWGRGKSRVLLEWARHHGGSVRFARSDAGFSRHALGLTAVDPCVLVVDDIQRRRDEDLRELAAMLVRFGDQVKLLGATRTSQMSRVTNTLMEQGIEAAAIVRQELRALTDRERRDLVSHILNQDQTDELAFAIARRTKGSTLACVIAARLVRRGMMSAAEIEGSREFELHVLEQYRKTLLADVGPELRESHDDVLRLVALAGPIRPADLAAMQSLAHFLDWPVDRLLRTVAALEDTGLLLRGGGLVRIPVDAVAETTLLRACVTAHGESTGYAERALAALTGQSTQNILRNLSIAEADAARLGLKVRFLDGVWQQLRKEYKKAPGSGRLQLLADLAELAPFQPEEALGFAQEVLAAGPPPPETHPWLRGMETKMPWIHERLAALVESALRIPRLLGRACDVLWMMAEAVDPALAQQGKAPERLLEEAGKYRLWKRPSEYEAFIQWAERRSEGTNRIPGFRMVQYLRPLLDKEIEHQWFDGVTVTLSSRGLRYNAFSDIRSRVLELLERFAQEDELRTVASAIRALGEVLNEPQGQFQRAVSDDETAQWKVEQLDALERLQRIQSGRDLRSIDLCIHSAVLWHARHAHKAEVRRLAGTILKQVSTALAGTVELAVTQSHELTIGISEEEAEHHDAAIAKVARNLIEQGRDPHELVTEIARVVRDLVDMGRQPNPRRRLYEIGRCSADFAEVFVNDILSTARHPLGHAIDAVLTAILVADPRRGKPLVEKVLETGNPEALMAVAQQYRWNDWPRALGEGLASRHLQGLLSHNHTGVRSSALLAVGHATDLSTTGRLGLLLNYDTSAAPDTVEEWATALVGPGLHTKCGCDDVEGLLQQLASARKFEFWSCGLLKRICKLSPDQAVDFLFTRIDRAADGTDDFDPIPNEHNGDPLESLTKTQRKSALMALGDRLTDQRFQVAQAAAALQRCLINGDPTAMQELRLEWAESEDEVLVLRAASSFGGEEPESLLDQEATVGRILQAAQRRGGELFDRVHGELLGFADGGMRSRTPGHPSARDVQMRDRALQIAGKYPLGTVEREFYDKIAARAGARIESDLREDEEDALRQ